MCLRFVRKIGLHFFTYIVQMATMNVADAHEVLPGLWLGNRNASQDEAWLREKNIEAVFNCTKDIPFLTGPWAKYRVPVDDNLQDDQIRNLELWSWEVTYKISHEMKLGKKVLVHCAAGMQRSAACVAMFLISQFRCTTDEAIAYTKSRRPIAFYGNANFYRSIRGFENSFRKFIMEKGLSEKLPRLRLPASTY